MKIGAVKKQRETSDEYVTVRKKNKKCIYFCALAKENRIRAKVQHMMKSLVRIRFFDIYMIPKPT